MTATVDAKRILVVRTDKIGDMLLSTPAIRSIRQAWPMADLTVLASPYNAPAILGWSVPDRIQLYDRAWPLARRVAAARDLRRRRFDLCIVLQPDLEAFLVARLTGAAVRAGVVHARRLIDRLLSPALLTRRYICRVEQAAERGDPIPHEVEQTREVLSGCGIAWAGDELVAVQTPDAHRWAERLLLTLSAPTAPLVGLHLSDKWFDPGWTLEHFQLLLETIVSCAGGVRVVVTCGPMDGRPAERVLSLPMFARVTDAESGTSLAVGADGRILVVPVDFPRWAAVFAHCAVVVTCDTGALHLASAVGRPVVAVYAAGGFARNSRQFAPWRVPSRVLHDGPFADVLPQIALAVSELADRRERDMAFYDRNCASWSRR